MNVTGLQGLNLVGGEFWIDNNDLLTDLTPFNNLTTVGLSLYVVNNGMLSDLNGLGNIDPNSIASLNIYNNPQLSECDVQSICDYLTLPGALVTVGNNAPGCNSPEEVEEACLTSIEEIETGIGITIIPNPTKDKISISLPEITGKNQLSIFNINGEKVLERQLTDNETQIDISVLSRGVYFVRVQDEKMTEVTKLIKQ